MKKQQIPQIKKPSLNLKKLTKDQLKQITGGIGWPSHASARQ
jgi:bacteriocin-like protein